MSETRVDPDSGATLVPVDHDPYTEPEPPGYFDKIGRDLADFWQQPLEHVKQRLGDIGQSFVDVARDYSGQVEGYQEAARTGIPTASAGDTAGFLAQHILGAAPAGTLSAGLRLPGGRAVYTSTPELETRLPLESRRVGGYESGVGTQPVAAADWLQHDLTAPGSGLQASADDLQNAWDRAVADTGARSPEQAAHLAQYAADHPEFGPGTPQFWDKALQQPDRARYWYEVSTKKLQENAPDFSPAEQRRLFDVVAATSPQADPYANMRRAVGVLAENAQGLPVATDLIGPGSVRSALSPEGLAGAKTGNFSDTFAHIGGLDDRPPISVDDRQVAALHGVDPNLLGSESGQAGAAYYELLSRFYQNLRDAENDARPGVTAGTENPLESWQLQALGWTQTRADKLAAKAGIEGMDDYGQVVDRLNRELADNGVDTSRGLFSKEVLQNPNTPNLVSGTRPYFMSPTTATIEAASTMTPQGAQAHELASYLPSPDAGLPWANNARFDLERVQRRAMEGLARGSSSGTGVASDLVSALMGRPAQLSRIDTRGQGMFEGKLSPNMRIPLVAKTGSGFVDLDEGQRKALLGAIGEAWDQQAMAGSKFRTVDEGAALAPGEQRTYSLFVPESSGLDPDAIKAFSNEIGGYPLNVSRPANGTLLDINIGGYDAGPSYEAVKAAAERLFPEHDSGHILERAYNSDYLEHPEYQGQIDRFWQGVRDAGQADDGGRGRGAGDPDARIRDFEAAREKARGLARERDQGYQKWIDKYGPRIDRHRQSGLGEQSALTPPPGARLVPVDYDPFAGISPA